jgi:hypothetical protein
MSYDVGVKEAVEDYECSPFDLLNEIGRDDDVTDQSGDVTNMLDDQLKMESAAELFWNIEGESLKTEVKPRQQSYY